MAVRPKPKGPVSEKSETLAVADKVAPTSAMPQSLAATKRERALAHEAAEAKAKAQERARSAKQASESLLRDIDAVLARLDDGIAKEHRTMDVLLERLRRPAA